MLANILHKLELEIRSAENYHPKMIPGDAWLLVSALHKGIRRGDWSVAGSAATSLMHLDKKRFWSRLQINALEDCGVASPDVITKVIAATVSSAWRKQIGEVRVGLYLTKLLCEAVKIRLADSVFILAERSKAYNDIRLKLAAATDKTLINHVTDIDKPLVERCIALWLLAGTRKFPSDYMPPRLGSVDNAVKALRLLDTPKELTEACIRAIPLSPWPLSVMTPLLWQEVQKHKTRIRYCKIPAADDVKGLPHYSADMFTRTGKSCIRELKATTPELKNYSTLQLGLGVFYTEGGLIDKTITAPELDEIINAGELTDIESSGLNLTQYKKLRQCLINNKQELATIRNDQLTQHLNWLAYE
jgi:hypothetical protein